MGIGIESWTAYGHKTGTAAKTPAEKYAAVCQRLAVVRKYIPGIAANMIWPSDTDQGPQPLDLTAGLMEDCPFLWTPINTPVAFGGTPMYAQMKREGRVLPLPLVFQTAGYLNIVPKHYGPAETLRGFIDLVEGASQWGRWRRRHPRPALAGQAGRLPLQVGSKPAGPAGLGRHGRVSPRHAAVPRGPRREGSPVVLAGAGEVARPPGGEAHAGRVDAGATGCAKARKGEEEKG